MMGKRKVSDAQKAARKAARSSGLEKGSAARKALRDQTRKNYNTNMKFKKTQAREARKK